jgi:ATP-dependent protease ClpP protease subunit
LPKKLDLTELFGAGVKQDERTFHKQMVNIHEFYLSGEIESPENYISWFDTIRYASENDVIKININSGGGDVYTSIQFMRVLQETAASIVISVEGLCASAATMIMLCGESFEISDHSTFMIHNYSGGAVGKGGEMLDQLSHERKWSEKLLREVYKDFLTDEEIKSVLDNKDIWMDGDEVIKRLKFRQEKLEEAAKKDEVVEEPVKQPRRRRKPVNKPSTD